MRIITVANHKGGTGKTTSSLNVGAGIARTGSKVLLIDLDPQGSLSLSLGVTDTSATISSALRGDPLRPLQISKRLDLIPSSLDLSVWETEVSSRPGWETVLRDLLRGVRGDYQYIVIDPPPSLQTLTVNSLVASDIVFIPTQAEYLALRGLGPLLRVIEAIRKRLNPDLRVGGIFITQFNSRRVLHRNVVKSLEDHFKDKLLSTRIRDTISLAEAPVKGLDIYRYAPNSYGAEDYLALTKEILKRAKISPSNE